jgi:hypothetical protein
VSPHGIGFKADFESGGIGANSGRYLLAVALEAFATAPLAIRSSRGSKAPRIKSQRAGGSVGWLPL